MMSTCSSHMERSALIILMVNSFCAFSQFAHETNYVVGCFDDRTTVIHLEFDEEEMLHVDFEKREIVHTLPPFVVFDPSIIIEDDHLFRNALKAKTTCAAVIAYMKVEGIHPQEQTDPPDSIIYTADEEKPGVENDLICFLNHFYPPSLKVNWTKNGLPVSEGVSVSQYFPNKDQTFHQFSTLKFTPREGDIYGCTVEHKALDKPQTRFWEAEFTKGHQSLGPDIFCGVGLGLGLLLVAAGTFLIVKALQAT